MPALLTAANSHLGSVLVAGMSLWTLEEEAQPVPVVVRHRRGCVEACSLQAGGQELVVGVVVGQDHLGAVAGGGSVDSAGS